MYQQAQSQDNPYGMEDHHMLGPGGELANKFLHAQSTWACKHVSAVCVYFIFTILAGAYFVTINTSWASLPAQFKQTGEGLGQAPMVNQMWVGGLMSLIFACCCSGCVVCVSRHMVESRANLKICCVIDSCFSCIYCCMGLGTCVFMLLMITTAAALGEPTTICGQAIGQANSGQLIAPNTAPGGGTFQSNPQFQSCTRVVEALKWVSILASIYACVAGSCELAMSGACGAGAKYANETQEFLETGVHPGAYGGQQGYY
jgi:hypothetical protein